jgi:hypothetical protein
MMKNELTPYKEMSHKNIYSVTQSFQLWELFDFFMISIASGLEKINK